jgi:16S rRNA (cytosine1402-N4)-methyltransferase
MIKGKGDTDHGYHIPALLQQTVDGLITDPDGVYVDVTYGGGGHSKEILERLTQKGKLYAFDQDEEAIANKIPDERLRLIKSNYRFFENYLVQDKVVPIDGILADIGVSSHQFDTGKRGFSIRFDEPLDMRMDTSAELDALTVLNEYEENKLADVLYLYGELHNSRLLAAKIVKARQVNRIVTPTDLKNAIAGSTKPQLEKDQLVQLFQAIRIEVNDELEVLKILLEGSLRVLKPGGRIAVISYHSLEDRLVKNFFKSGNFEGKIETDVFGNVKSPIKPLHNKPIIPDKNEIEKNPRSRSAKLRIGIKK